MNIGIDAKRIFLNKAGLGSWGRNISNGLNKIESTNKYFLYTPKKTNLYDTKHLNKNFIVKESNSIIKPLWRSVFINKDLKRDKIDIFHGISNELPFVIDKKIRKIVDIHDLLFLRFPDFYPFIDRKIYEIKTRNACKISDKIITVSNASKQDIVKYYGVNPQKIEVIYPSCDDSYYKTVANNEKQQVLEKYNLPKEYILCVGTIQERKNQKQIIEALKISKNKIPVVLVGGGGEYKKQVIEFAKNNKIELVLPKKFVVNKDLPAIYQQAKIFVFPGFYEGFGLPVLEAMASKTNVITSINTSMAEIVQDTNCLINPLSAEDIAEKIDFFLENKSLETIENNFLRAQYFTNTKFAKRVLKVYDEVGNL